MHKSSENSRHPRTEGGIAAVSMRLKSALADDPALTPFKSHLKRRLALIEATQKKLTLGKKPLEHFAAGHEYFGLHFRSGSWVLREWAPNATAIYLIGDFSRWHADDAYRLTRINTDGVWEIRLPPEQLHHGDLYRLFITWRGGSGDRLPAYCRRVVQDPQTLIFNAQVWKPRNPYRWQSPEIEPTPDALFIYEAHVGMAQDAEKVGTYREFAAQVIPRIVRSGYNALQLMAIQEHPYYASFGYQVSSFFAPSSRFGTPEDLKYLIDTAHGAGLVVIMDLVHSHAVRNEVEGLSRFDGTAYQYFHEGARGEHVAWNSRCFDYAKPQVLHFLLSNCRYWMDAFHVDGFRFDGVTSMLYTHHGLGRSFTSYADYFNSQVDESALVYLALANRLIHRLRPRSITIAEDISGMPGLARPLEKGGYGFDYRFAMGIADYWIKLLKDVPDENWHMGDLWHELTNRRHGEKSISYAECHDQALVGDQTLIFRMVGADMYDRMHVDSQSPAVDRGMALHKMIRLITLATAGHGYLNFMGNEFGHPEWIDFPRAGNNWSLHYARRQWHLADDENLRYHFLGRFDRDMLRLARKTAILEDGAPQLLLEHSTHKIIAFTRAALIFVFNFHPQTSFEHYRITAPAGKYRLCFDSDGPEYGGFGRLAPAQEHFTLYDSSTEGNFLSLYLPCRTAQVLEYLGSGPD